MPPGQRVPRHLAEYVADGKLPPSCPWSVGDPLVARPTAIQQRVCVAKGNPKYSSQMGGVLYTIYAPSGKESLEYRLLHVYSSAEGVAEKEDGGTMPNNFTTPKRLSQFASNSTRNASCDSSMSESFDETHVTTNGAFSPDGTDSRPSSALTLPLFVPGCGLDPNSDADIASVFAEPDANDGHEGSVAPRRDPNDLVPHDAPAGHPSSSRSILFGAPGRHEVSGFVPYNMEVT
jgi:hypothetical protein